MLVFNTAFFPSSDPVAGLIAALMTQAVGFVARPLGGWFFSNLGDRIGRRRILLIVAPLFGAASLAAAFASFFAVFGFFKYRRRRILNLLLLVVSVLTNPVLVFMVAAANS